MQTLSLSFSLQKWGKVVPAQLICGKAGEMQGCQVEIYFCSVQAVLLDLLYRGRWIGFADGRQTCMCPNKENVSVLPQNDCKGQCLY